MTGIQTPDVSAGHSCPTGRGSVLVAYAFLGVLSDDDRPLELFLAEPLPLGSNLVKGLKSALATDCVVKHK